MFSKEFTGDFSCGENKKESRLFDQFSTYIQLKLQNLITNYKTILYSFMLLLCFIVCKVTGKSHNCIMLFNCKAREYFDLSFSLYSSH